MLILGDQSDEGEPAARRLLASTLRPCASGGYIWMGYSGQIRFFFFLFVLSLGVLRFYYSISSPHRPFFRRASPDLYPPHVISPILRASSDSSSFLCCSESLNRAFRSCQPSSSSSFSVFSSAASFRPALLLSCASLTVLKCQDRLGVITLPPSRSLSTSV